MPSGTTAWHGRCGSQDIDARAPGLRISSMILEPPGVSFAKNWMAIWPSRQGHTSHRSVTLMFNLRKERSNDKRVYFVLEGELPSPGKMQMCCGSSNNL